MERTDFCGDLRLKDVGRNVVLLGWVHRRRNHGGLLFIDLRDRSGIVQVTVREGTIIPDVRNEYVIEARGTVARKEAPNPRLPTGEVEVLASGIKVISRAETTPLIIADRTDALEDVRLKYRYLDLRRPCLQRNLILRSRIVQATHEYFDAHGFVEIETPCLTVSTPEGARDYLVPSRVNKGAFYALPQSPQLYKQLLMIAGMERYYQIARCFRDEDLRQDRQPEFTQVDVEASFLDADEIMAITEGYLKDVFHKTLGVELKTPFRRLSYDEALSIYGSDHPDTRFGMTLFAAKEALSSASFKPFLDAESVEGIVVPGGARTFTRKAVDALSLEARKFGADGIGALKPESGALTGSLAKHLDEKAQKALLQASKANEGDAIVLAWGKREAAVFLLGALRCQYARDLGLIKPDSYDPLWVVGFPLFEKDKGTGAWKALHHPFTSPTAETVSYLESDPGKVYSAAYDMIINGHEVGGGSIRIHDPELQKKVFEVLGLSDEDIKRKFGYFVDAFKYGTPPHGGIAFGLERLAMIVCGTENIRDVIAFPKNLKAASPMSGAPKAVDQAQLDELGIIIK